MKTKWLYLVLFLTLQSCVDDRPYKTYTAKELITVEIPEDMQLQAEGIIPNQQVYLLGEKKTPLEMGMDFYKKNDLTTYGVPFTTDEIYNSESEKFAEVLSEMKMEKPKNERISHMESSYGLILGKINNEAYIFRLTVSNGGAYFYSFYVGAKEKDFKKNEKVIKHIVESVDEFRDFEALNNQN